MECIHIPAKKNNSKKEIKKVAERWKDQYFYIDEGWRLFLRQGNAENTYNSIIEAKTLDEVDTVIGNISWTHNSCHGCSTFTRKALIKFDDGEYTKQYCKSCVKEMLKAFKSSSTSS
jgi:hypothetical protein